MRTKYRFIEGYRGNDTVRGWRDFDSIYHAVFRGYAGQRRLSEGERVRNGAGGAAAAARHPYR